MRERFDSRSVTGLLEIVGWMLYYSEEWGLFSSVRSTRVEFEAEHGAWIEMMV